MKFERHLQREELIEIIEKLEKRITALEQYIVEKEL